MVAISPMRFLFLFSLSIGIITGIVSIAGNGAFQNKSTRSNSTIAIFTTNLIGVVLLVTALALLICLLFKCSENYKTIMLIVIGCTFLALISLSVSTGFEDYHNGIPYKAWLLSSLWVTVISTGVSIVFLFSDPESI